MEHVWHHLEVQDVLTALKTNRQGLTAHDVLKRRELVGLNELPREKSARAIVVFLRQFKNSLIAILLVAAGISFALKDFIDANVILAAVALNVVLGFVQELKAERELTALRSFVTFQAIVRREGSEEVHNAAELVPGDIIVLKAGSRIPADARLVHTQELRVNEAALTGESHAVVKSVQACASDTPLAERTSMVYMGTTVEEGGGLGVVTATGLATEVGVISTMLRETKETATPLQKRLNTFSATLGIILLVVATIIFFIGLALGKGLTEMLSLSIALAVAAIPEGLIIGVTAVLAVGMKRILERKALVRKLLAAETLGSTTVICTDKTGTLTEGEMSVVNVVTEGRDLGIHHGRPIQVEHLREGSSTLLAFVIGLACNDAHIANEDAELHHRVVTGSPTERALVVAAHIHGLTRNALDQTYPRIDSIPFTSESRFMATLHRSGSEGVVFLKGTLDRVLEACTSVDIDGKQQPLSDDRREAIRKKAETMSSEGLRILALAHRHVSRTMTDFDDDHGIEQMAFVGFFAIKDPLRATAKETVERCQKAGIRVVMITGDHPLTAAAIGRELGLPAEKENVCTGTDLARLSDVDFQERIAAISIFARVSPKDKLRIVNAWQAKGEVVAVSGDGVNDAPALKSAAIGVAFGSGTEVAKEASDILLLDNNFQTIVAAVQQGRVIFENIRKITLYLISDSFAAVLVVLMAFIVDALIIDFPIPLLAAQILWINLIADGLPNLALTFEPEESDIMVTPPRNPKEPIITRRMQFLALSISFITGISSFLVYLCFLAAGQDIVVARTAAFLALGITSILTAFNVRSLRHSLWKMNPFTNWYLMVAVAGGILVELAAVYIPQLRGLLGTTPLTGLAWLIVIAVILVVFFMIESVKRVLLPHHHHHVLTR